MTLFTLLALGYSTLFGALQPAEQEVSPDNGVVIVVSGAVTSAASGTGLEGVQVYIPTASVGALSNQSGRYLLRLSDEWLGREVELRVEMIGFEGIRKTHVLTSGENVLDFRLTSQAISLDQAVVTGAASGARTEAQLPMRTYRDAMRAAAPAQERARQSNMKRALSIAANPFNREGYAHIEENGFRPVDAAPLSTFSIDVDRASYANVRRFVKSGARPPADAVRIEELINYFPYSDPSPEGDEPFAVTTEVIPAPWQPEHLLVRVGVRGQDIQTEDLPPNNLVFLLDVSGSMKNPDKLPLLKKSFRLLVDQMREQDRVAIVVYAGAAGLVLPSTSGSEKATILEAIERLEAGGSTAGGAGIQLAYQVARQHHREGANSRVILATDGDFNVGASSDGEMVRLIEEKREEGTFLTVLGFGTGNLQDAKMEQLADHGNGNFAYIDSELEAKKVLVAEMSGTLHTIAKDVKIQVEFNPAHVAEYRLIGYENRMLADEDFNDDKKDAGELGAGHTVTALYELIMADDDDLLRSAGVDALRFQQPGSLTEAADSEELMYVKLRYKRPDGDVSRLVGQPLFDRRSEEGASMDLRFAAAVAGWGMLLRNSEFSGDFTFGDVEELARGAVGADLGGYRAEFVDLVARSRAMGMAAIDDNRD